MIRAWRALKIGQPVRGYGMETHLTKSGTPTMGGVLVLFSIAFATLLWFDLSNRFVWIVLWVTMGFGAIGWVDDWRKVVRKDPEGMRSREKYFWQSVVGLVAGFYLLFSISESSNWRVLELFFAWVRSGFDLDFPPKINLLVPFFKEISYPLGGIGFVILTYLVIVGASNAVNLTDGLDGLAIMPVVMVGSALGVFAYVTGSAVYSQLPAVPAHPGLGRAAGVLLGHGRRGPGLPVVQHPPGAGLHGRRGRAGAGRRARHHRGHRAPGDRVLRHGRHLRGRGDLGDGAGDVLQVHQEALRRRPARAQDGAAAPPLREERLARDAGRRALLDHHDAAVPRGPFHVEASLTTMRHLHDLPVLVLGLGASGLAMARWCARHGAPVTVADTREAPPALAALQAELPAVRFVGGPLTAALVEGTPVRAVYRSPGLSPATIAPVVDAARAMGLPVGGELDLFAQRWRSEDGGAAGGAGGEPSTGIAEGGIDAVEIAEPTPSAPSAEPAAARRKRRRRRAGHAPTGRTTCRDAPASVPAPVEAPVGVRRRRAAATAEVADAIAEPFGTPRRARPRRPPASPARAPPPGKPYVATAAKSGRFVAHIAEAVGHQPGVGHRRGRLAPAPLVPHAEPAAQGLHAGGARHHRHQRQDHRHRR